jgi:hypothetical protein
MILNGSAHGFLDLKINKQTLQIDPGTQKKKLGMLNVIKQLQHFILCNMMCYGALKSNIIFCLLRKGNSLLYLVIIM